jgi:hypothetical protein
MTLDESRPQSSGPFGGRIDLSREGEKLRTEYDEQPAVLLQVVGLKESGNSGGGSAP